jgi:hypothetical protein
MSSDKSKSNVKREYENVEADLQAWYRPIEGNVLEGKLVDFRDADTKNGRKILYLIHTTAPCIALENDADEDTEPAEWPADVIIGLWSSGGLNAMKKVRIGTQVRVECIGEKDIGRQSPMRVFTVQQDKRELGRGHSYVSAKTSRDIAEDDIPF